MSNKNQIIVLYSILVSILIADFFIYIGIIKMFLGWNSTIAAGVLGFCGALIGGGLTLLGVIFRPLATQYKHTM